LLHALFNYNDVKNVYYLISIQTLNNTVHWCMQLLHINFVNNWRTWKYLIQQVLLISKGIPGYKNSNSINKHVKQKKLILTWVKHIPLLTRSQTIFSGSISIPLSCFIKSLTMVQWLANLHSECVISWLRSAVESKQAL
jgi:hypothetical protein